MQFRKNIHGTFESLQAFRCDLFDENAIYTDIYARSCVGTCDSGAIVNVDCVNVFANSSADSIVFVHIGLDGAIISTYGGTITTYGYVFDQSFTYADGDIIFALASDVSSQYTWGLNDFTSYGINVYSTLRIDRGALIVAVSKNEYQPWSGAVGAIAGDTFIEWTIKIPTASSELFYRPIATPFGYYSGPDTAPLNQKYLAILCTASELCYHGVKYTKPLFPSGVCDGNTHSFSINENEAFISSTMFALDSTVPDMVAELILSDGSSASPFLLTASKHLEINQHLDFETTPSYNLSLKYNIDEFQYTFAECAISITVVNQVNSPQITNAGATRTIDEFSPANSIVSPSVAVSHTETYTYAITSQTPSIKFSIGETTGVITTLAELDHSDVHEYTLVVEVTDSGNLKATENVVISVNCPIGYTCDAGGVATRVASFGAGICVSSEHTLQLNENDVNYVSSDVFTLDAAVTGMSYTLQKPSDALSDPYAIDGSGHVIVSGTAPNHESAAVDDLYLTYRINNIPRDYLTCHIAVTVSDVNEAPIVANEFVVRELLELLPVNTTVGALVEVVDTDKDDLMIMRIVGGDVGGLFSIDNNGTIYTQKEVRYSEAFEYYLEIEVEDFQGLITKATIRIDIICAGEFICIEGYYLPAFYFQNDVCTDRKHTIEFEENSVVASLANFSLTGVPPNMIYSLSLLEGGSDIEFSLLPNGSVTMNALLDYEKQSSYVLFLVYSVVGKGTYAYCDIALTVKDVNEKPHILHSDVRRSIQESKNAGEPVVDPIAIVDPDMNDTHKYELLSNGHDLFMINDSTGDIYSTAMINYTEHTTFEVNVLVSDSGNLIDNRTIYVDVICAIGFTCQNGLRLQRATFRQGVCNDGNHKFSINEGGSFRLDVTFNLNSYFEELYYTLHENGTELRLAADGQLTLDNPLNYERKKEYMFLLRYYVTGYDTLYKGCDIHIKVLDINKPPVVSISNNSFTLDENIAYALETNLSVIDQDFNDTFTIEMVEIYNTSISEFSLNGSILIIDALNFEHSKYYELKVSAIDKEGLSASVMISI